MRLTLLHNPQAGHGRHRFDEVETIARALGHTIQSHATGDPRWLDALADPGDLVVVLGGDGTVAAIVEKMLGTSIPIAVVPLGTANNVARVLGVGGTLREIVESWSAASPVAFDVGVAKGSGELRCFLECVGVGGFGRLIAHSDARERSTPDEDRERKLARDRLALRELLADGPLQGVHLELDGVDHGGEYAMVEISNLGSLGPRLHLAPGAAPDDGHLHVVKVDAEGRARLIAYLDALARGEAAVLDLPAVRAERVEIECETNELHVDGELWRGPGGLIEPRSRTRLELALLREAVRFVRPAPPG